jgi:polyisoprenoid-binding protein YceI
VLTTGATSANGGWNVDADADTFVGYRIEEQFAAGAVNKTAVGRTPGVTGKVTVDGAKIPAATFEADMTLLKSDDSRRDSALKSKAIESANFPKATFVLGQPIDLGGLPKIGSEVALKASGALTLHGVTKEITLDLTARWAGDRIDIAGKAAIALSDFGIEPPTITGMLTVQDKGTLELQLHLVR